MASTTPPGAAPRVRLDVGAALAERAAWALEALLARRGVRGWYVVGEGAPADLVVGPGGDVPHDPSAWEFSPRFPPDAALDPLAATFWWLARVEEQLAPSGSFDEHGRFRADASHAVRSGAPLATPVDELAHELPLAPGPVAATGVTWSIVPTHDVDLPWRWGPGAVRRTVRRARDRARSGDLAAAAATLAALAAAPVWRLLRRDPWCNAARIRRLEWRWGARSTSYLLVGSHAAHDGDARLQQLGRARYLAELGHSAPSRRTTRRGGRDDASASRTALGGLVGLHGSYTSLTVDGRLRDERSAVESLAGGAVTDHRSHYLRHQPVRDWPRMAAAGITTDSTLGFAEQPGFRAGTAHPYRAWDHVLDAPLDLVVIPLALMDASLDDRYLGLGATGAGRELAIDVLDRVRAVGGCASVLVHNDRLCTVDSRPWTRLYGELLRRVRDGGGSAITAHEAGIAYRALLPAHRLHRTASPDR